ncbi:type 2A phosphatase activator TIP41 [Punctularia strigosozonata HHB-11173 SS5]|uniref:type 2A phosphatase activator TIP41 n=1 Tax=Punctularia strigosozonata (strain HHB-11173) TaxID=741275 RepID=UPI0004417928|nr:type 2A phosphatase activator TIP41 [Punctularia strigosozonata HHB-11173 SS5]EIN10995.1 type 2A phosphatase activator TIP41 [Punctularia strigosozonata HHB-11173 SS5]
MASSTDLPEHKLLESPNSRTIQINGWSITACTNPIASAVDADALQAQLGIPLPEMTFAHNVLTLEHRASGWKYAFRTADALAGVRSGDAQEGDGVVKVGYADATGSSSAIPLPQTSATKQYDWTYTTVYSGHLEAISPDEVDEKPVIAPDGFIPWHPADPSDPLQAIPIAELSRRDPILFYAEIPVFEDELHDNGASHLLVRIRVMPSCFFVLARFTLRVDNVLFRMHDTRIYHSFSSSPSRIVRETSGWEAPYDRVKRQLSRRDDLTPLTDPNWVGHVLSGMPSDASQRQGAGTGWRGLGTRTEVALLAE